MKDPVSVASVMEQEGSFVVNVKLLMVNDEPLLLATNEVEKAKTGLLFESVSAAVQLPLMLPELLFPEPQPARTRPADSKTPTANFFIKKILLFGMSGTRRGA
jgi:hypothetical protein